MLEAVLAAGARADLYRRDGTPLGYAAINGLVDAVEVLVQHSQGDKGGGRAILAAVDKTGQTALMNLCALRGGVNEQHARCFDLLLSATGMPVDAVDDKGDTALHHCVAAGNGDLAEKLVKHGVRTDICNREGEGPLYMAYCADPPALAGRLVALGVALTPAPHGLPSPPHTQCDPAVFVGRTLDAIYNNCDRGWSTANKARVAEYDPGKRAFRLEPDGADGAGGTTQWVQRLDQWADAEDGYVEYVFHERHIQRYMQACKGLPPFA